MSLRQILKLVVCPYHAFRETGELMHQFEKWSGTILCFIDQHRIKDRFRLSRLNSRP